MEDKGNKTPVKITPTRF